MKNQKKHNKSLQLLCSSLIILALNTNLTACMTTSDNKPTDETNASQTPSSNNIASNKEDTSQAPVTEATSLPQVPSGVELANNKDAQFAEQLTKLQRFDPKAEAEQNIAAQNYVLKAASPRGISIPGVSPEDYESVKDKCTLEFLEGLGDVVYGPNHMTYRKQVSAQAKVYNEVMFAACQKL